MTEFCRKCGTESKGSIYLIAGYCHNCNWKLKNHSKDGKHKGVQ